MWTDLGKEPVHMHVKMVLVLEVCHNSRSSSFVLIAQPSCIPKEFAVIPHLGKRIHCLWSKKIKYSMSYVYSLFPMNVSYANNYVLNLSPPPYASFLDTVQYCSMRYCIVEKKTSTCRKKCNMICNFCKRIMVLWFWYIIL